MILLSLVLGSVIGIVFSSEDNGKLVWLDLIDNIYVNCIAAMVSPVILVSIMSGLPDLKQIQFVFPHLLCGCPTAASQVGDFLSVPAVPHLLTRREFTAILINILIHWGNRCIKAAAFIPNSRKGNQL